VKAVNVSAEARAAEIKLNGVDVSGTAKVTTLAAEPQAENSFEHPTAVAPLSSTVEVRSGKIATHLSPYSVTVYRIPSQAVTAKVR
jgi:alpha-L-arabinofuranosidase